MKMIYATTNKYKVQDIKKIIDSLSLDIEIVSLNDINFKETIKENGNTFEENSKIKAQTVKKYCDNNNISYDVITADDAGLCVDCLDGKPGVYSARYAGENSTQEEKLDKLLEEIRNTKDKRRTAKFECVLTSYLKNGKEIITKGESIGRIAEKYEELGGLTYSPIFIPNGFNVPMSKLTAREYEKAHNHRDTAVKLLLEQILVKH